VLPHALPDLSLTQGQLLWAVGHGNDPNKLLKDQIRYLRLLGIPAGVAEKTPGSGNQIRYDFFDLVEMGIAITALGHRFRPKDISAVLVGERTEFRKRVAEAWLELPDAALDAEWVKSRGRLKPFLEQIAVVRLHDRRSEKWGKLDFAWIDDEALGVELFAPVERFEDGETKVLLPLNTLMLPWVAWALEAPAIRTGPK
jgi:hypothetical protein